MAISWPSLLIESTNSMITVFIQIVAAATINFSLAGVQLLIEGGLLFEDGFYLFWRDTFAPIRWYLVVID